MTSLWFTLLAYMAVCLSVLAYPLVYHRTKRMVLGLAGIVLFGAVSILLVYLVFNPS